MEVFAGEYRPAAAIGLVRHGAIGVTANATEPHTFQDYRRHVADRGQIVGGYTVRANIR